MLSVTIEKVRLVLVRDAEDEVFALRDVCPHMGGQLSRGRLVGTTLPSKPGAYIYGLEGKIIRCPWHAWEFDVRTGASLHDPGRQRVKAYRAYLEGEGVYVEV
jgi:3-phenylpropionate/trans-cinnamate dioxygenase ferredoxin subunit